MEITYTGIPHFIYSHVMFHRAPKSVKPFLWLYVTPYHHFLSILLWPVFWATEEFSNLFPILPIFMYTVYFSSDSKFPNVHLLEYSRRFLSPLAHEIQWGEVIRVFIQILSTEVFMGQINKVCEMMGSNVDHQTVLFKIPGSAFLKTRCGWVGLSSLS